MLIIAFFTQISTIFLNCSFFTYFTFVLITNIIKIYVIIFIKKNYKKNCDLSPRTTGEPLVSRLHVTEDFTAALRINVTNRIRLIGFRIDHIAPCAISVFAY